MSTLFNLRIPKKHKDVDQHPWQNRIKENLFDKIKYAHNSVRNPEYPKKPEKATSKNGVKFTIIGNRVTKEFNYCEKLVKGLHKYRPKIFDPPVIRGVTGVEWPTIWNDLKIRFGGMTYCIRSQVAVLINDKILGDEHDLNTLIMEKYNYHLVLDYYKEGVKQFSDFVRNSSRTCAYMHISIDDQEAGTLIFMLYSDIVPYTCENFLRLCQSKKGGYSGTPVHRIVEDGWIQCGGFGLKSIDFRCENFIIPHDRRGLLCMANDGRDIECSTQFFVLLQPAHWMDKKYVAFGQLIDGEGTLQKIENVPTYYEAPKKSIIIYEAGILNLECQDIMINKGTVEYIQGHIENLFDLGETLLEELIYKVFAEIDRREKRNEEEQIEEEEENENIGLRSTQRFLKKKEDFNEQDDRNHEQRRSTIKSKSQVPILAESVNNDFDVEDYVPEDYEPEEYVYSKESPSPVIKPDIPYYIPLTDVPYPGEVDSTYDLKKLLRGDYCLEADIDIEKQSPEKEPSLKSCILQSLSFIEFDSEQSLESEDEKEIALYLEATIERVSFAGHVIKNIAKGLYPSNLKSDLLTDNELRIKRMAINDLKDLEDHQRKVSISVPVVGHDPRKISRRQTGVIDLEEIRNTKLISSFDDSATVEEELRRKVRIDPNVEEGIIRTSDGKSSVDAARASALTKLYDKISLVGESGPILKNYKPITESIPKTLMLTMSSHLKMRDIWNEKYVRPTKKADSLENVMSLQHGKKLSRKISSDYVKTIGNVEKHKHHSIRSVEYAKIRPSMTVAEYKMKNRKEQLNVISKESNDSSTNGTDITDDIIF